ncbi:beta-glucosidase [Phyllobacterium endophyticum]|uniref:beta-glucosidase n=1 Tax=Phyllobacterium endophyticum TaxID=1149773 RepID=UPI0011CAF14A|nr:beta-glucosidase [Phyllobacterium endophyticum]TXR50743.1 beta-glucosidase [Phyllobacterium endophyticum]
MTNAVFKSFFLAGFECSTHRRPDGRRLDLLAATDHYRRAETDYRQLADHGVHTARDGLRWHLIETRPGYYDWSSFLPMLKAANRSGTQVIWDLCHYGWPDDIDIWSPAFVERFARFAAAAAQLIRNESDDVALYCPVNEISYWAWAGGETGRINPCSFGRGNELKRNLVRAAIASIEAIRDVDPGARFITAEPLIHVDSPSPEPEHVVEAECYRLSQFEALDLLSGRIDPGLGGSPEYLDLVGVNFYPDNQWYLGGPTIPLGHHAYRRLSTMLQEVYHRYGRPLLIAETGAEGSARAAWLHYVSSEVQHAQRRQTQITGICLYPILDYPGWDNDRLCRVGLLGDVTQCGLRKVSQATAAELRRQATLIDAHARQG